MTNNELEKMKKAYEDIPIPDALDDIVEQALHKKPKKSRRPKWLMSTVAAAAIFTASINISPALAQSLAQIPAIGTVIEVLTFTQYEVADEHHEAHIDVPVLTPISEEISVVNEQFALDGQALYEQFQQEIEAIGDGYYALNSGYTVYTNTERLLSMSRYVEEISATASLEETFITVDKELKTVVTLPSLFTDDRYINAISANIIEQMQQRIQEQDAVYWIDAFADELPSDERFTAIDANESFYITEQHELVIVFNEYDVAPGYMGQVHFTIPSHVIAPLLANQLYIH